ncbi:MAG: two-component sensor histidine kinase [Symbiobacteriaceae bacterium]|jgi:signal transduction histidine kinase|nr:two-component sensor histidine kinase [Symbiobacteriaceae bacterium]
MRKPAVPVENVAEMIWGALLVIYLLGSGRPEYRTWPVALIFGLSAAAALLELCLRRRQWQFVAHFDAAVWTVLLSAMVAVTGGRSSEAWPAYIMMSLTAPSLGRPALHYGLMAVNSAIYIGVYAAVNPYLAPAVPALLLLRIGLFFLVTYVVDRSMARERAAQAAAVQASRDRVGELVSARDAERRRIAGDLHDWLGAGLVAPVRKLELALRTPAPDAARAFTQESIDALRGAHDELRRIMEALHPHLLEQLGPCGALREYCTTWSGEHGVALDFQGDTAPAPPPDVALAAYRILQEALNNAARHARGATCVQVALRLREGYLTLAVADDGAGMHPIRKGRGLRGMQERAEAFGGTLQVTSRPGHGTTVTATIPWTAPGE